jgi:hypothetical protein
VTLLVAVVGVTAVSFSAIVRQDQDATDGIKALTKMLDSVTAPRRLVLLPPSYPFDPYVRQFNEPDLNGDVLYGLDVGPPTLDVALADADRSLYRLHYEKPYGGLFSQGAAPVLEPLTVRRGRSIVVTATFHRPPDVVGDVTPYLHSDAGFTDPATVSSTDPDTVTATWVLGASPGATSDGVVVDDPMTVAVGFAVGGPVTDAQRFESRVVAGPDGQGGVALLKPGVSYRQYVFPGNKRAWSQENLAGPIDVRFAEQP